MTSLCLVAHLKSTFDHISGADQTFKSASVGKVLVGGRPLLSFPSQTPSFSLSAPSVRSHRLSPELALAPEPFPVQPWKHTGRFKEDVRLRVISGDREVDGFYLMAFISLWS